MMTEKVVKLQGEIFKSWKCTCCGETFFVNENLDCKRESIPSSRNGGRASDNLPTRTEEALSGRRSYTKLDRCNKNSANHPYSYANLQKLIPVTRLPVIHTADNSSQKDLFSGKDSCKSGKKKEKGRN